MRRTRQTRVRALFGIEVGLLVVGALVMLLPYLWMLSSAVKSPAETLRIPPVLVPQAFQWGNFSAALTAYAFPTYIKNSVVVAVAVTLSNMLIGSMAAYALTRFHFRGREVLFLIILSTLMLPVEVILIPLYLVVHGFGWLNSYQGLIIPLALDAFSIFLLRQFMFGFPRELIDAARVDGASEFAIYSRIVLPNIKPALAAVAVFSFRDSWDQLLWPLVAVNRDSLKTFPVGIAQFQNEASGLFNQQMAIAVIGMVPLVLLFILAQKAFVRGIATTGIK